MTLGTTTLAALAVLALSAAAVAYPVKEDDPFYYSRLLDYNKDAVRNLDGIGGGNLMRDLDVLRNRAAFFSRGNRDQDETKKQQQMAYHFMDPLMGNTIGTAKRAGCCDGQSEYPFGGHKRNMDEIDRSNFNSFVKKNFDEIDRSGFGSFVKKNFDEIDRSGFGKFVKRSAPQHDAEHPQN